MENIKYVQVKDPDSGALSEAYLLEVEAQNVIFEDKENLVEKMAKKSDKAIYGDNEVNLGRIEDSEKGLNSITLGTENIASGDYATAAGYNTIAAGDHSHVEGRYNIEDTENRYAFIIGNGYLPEVTEEIPSPDPIRSNAFAVDWEGKVYAKTFINGDGAELYPSLKSIFVNDVEYSLNGGSLILQAGDNITLTPGVTEGTDNEDIVDGSLTVIISSTGGGSGSGGGDGEYLPLAGGKVYGPVIIERDMEKVPELEDENFGGSFMIKGSSSQTIFGSNTIDTSSSGRKAAILYINRTAKNMISLGPGSSEDTSFIFNPKTGTGGVGWIEGVKDLNLNVERSFIWGINLNVEADYGHAFGSNSLVTGIGGSADGYNNMASGAYTRAEGYNVEARGDYSHAEGEATFTMGRGSHSEGYSTSTYGQGAHAEGVSSRVYKIYQDININTLLDDWNNFDTASDFEDSLTQKFSAAYGIGSHVQGIDCLAIGDYSSASGIQTIANGRASQANGIGSSVGGEGSKVDGYQNSVEGKISYADGYQNTIKGNYSNAYGYRNILKGNYLFSRGKDNKNIGADNFIFGQENLLFGNNIFLIGQSNKITETNTNSFIIGCGNQLSQINNNIITGFSNNIFECESNIVSGFSNNISQCSGNIITGFSNTLTEDTNYCYGTGNNISKGNNNFCFGIGNSFIAYADTLPPNYGFNTVLGQGNSIASCYNNVQGTGNNISFSNNCLVLGHQNNISQELYEGLYYSCIIIGNQNIQTHKERKHFGSTNEKNYILGNENNCTYTMGNYILGNKNKITNQMRYFIQGFNNTLSKIDGEGAIYIDENSEINSIIGCSNTISNIDCNNVFIRGYNNSLTTNNSSTYGGMLNNFYLDGMYNSFTFYPDSYPSKNKTAQNVSKIFGFSNTFKLTEPNNNNGFLSVEGNVNNITLGANGYGWVNLYLRGGNNTINFTQNLYDASSGFFIEGSGHNLNWQNSFYSTSGQVFHIEGKGHNFQQPTNTYDYFGSSYTGWHIEGNSNSLYRYNGGGIHIEGYYNYSYAPLENGSHIEGTYNKNYGAGTLFISGKNNTSYWNSSYYGAVSIEGIYNTCGYQNSSTSLSDHPIHIEGQYNYMCIATSHDSTYNSATHIEGGYNKVCAGNHVEGSYNVCGGIYNHIEGYYCTSAGLFPTSSSDTTGGDRYVSKYSHVEGYYAFNVGSYNHTEGAGQSHYGYNNGTTMNNLLNNYEDNLQNAIDNLSSSLSLLYHMNYGQYSHLEGKGNFIANGSSIHVEGECNVAGEGSWNHIENFGNYSSSTYNHIEGYRNFNEGAYNHIEGAYNSIPISSFVYNHIEGINHINTSNYTHIEGYSSNKFSNYSEVEEVNDIITQWKTSPFSYSMNSNFSHLEGADHLNLKCVATHQEGFKTIAIEANNAHVEGFMTTILGDYAHAEGNTTIAYGNGSHAEGMGGTPYAFLTDFDYSYDNWLNQKFSIAYGSGSHVEGTVNYAEGYSSHVEGRENYAKGDNSHVGGYQSKALETNSFVHGDNLIATAINQFVIGSYNLEDIDKNYIFIIGNGKTQDIIDEETGEVISTEITHSNALTVDKEGVVSASLFNGPINTHKIGNADFNGTQDITLEDIGIQTNTDMPIGTIITNDNPNSSGFEYGNWKCLGKNTMILSPLDETSNEITEVITYVWKRIEDEITQPEENESENIEGSN